MTKAETSEAMRPIQVFIVDDNPQVRLGPKQLIRAHPNLRVCGEANTGRKPSSHNQKTRPNNRTAATTRRLRNETQSAPARRLPENEVNK